MRSRSSSRDGEEASRLLDEDAEPRVTAVMVGRTPKITNLYVVCGLATIGGLLQGFDVSSLSAILATPQVRHPDVASSRRAVLLNS